MDNKQTRKIPIPEWNKYHPWPSPAGLRYRVFFADTMDFEKCIVRVRGRVLIDETAFFNWLEEQNTISLQNKSKG